MENHIGYWWSPSQDDQRVPGTLTYDPVQGLTLSASVDPLQGNHHWSKLLQIPSVREGRCSLVVHGVTHEGKRFTLYNGYVRSSNLRSHGINTANLFFNRGIQGAFVSSPADFRVDRVHARYHGLEAWLSINPFTADLSGLPERTAMSFERPAPIRVPIDDNRTFVVEWTWSGPDQYIVQNELSMAAVPWAGIEYKEPVCIDDACSDSCGISDLLSLLMGTSTTSYEIRFQSPEVVDRVGDRELHSPMRFLGARLPVKETPTNWMPHEVLLPLPEIQDSLETVITTWFDLQEHLRCVLVPYFAARRYPATFVEGRFFDAARVAEALHRALGPADEQSIMSDDEAEEIRCRVSSLDLGRHRDKVLSRLSDVHQPSFRRRLKLLMLRFQDITGDILGDDTEQKKFVQRVTDLRNMEAHLSGKISSNRNVGIEYLRLESKLRVIIDVRLLASLGLSESKIHEAMKGNDRYWFYASNQTWPWNQ